MNSDKLTIRYVPTNELHMYEGNSNTHDERQIEQIAESICSWQVEERASS